jgi:hypothetical protein
MFKKEGFQLESRIIIKCEIQEAIDRKKSMRKSSFKIRIIIFKINNIYLIYCFLEYIIFLLYTYQRLLLPSPL